MQLAPLTILVGKNNTGKSYVATLIWALRNLRRLTSQNDARKSRPKWFVDFVDLSQPDLVRVLEIDQEKGEDIVQHLNDLFKKGGSGFLSRVFAYTGFENTRVQLGHPKFKPFKVRVAILEETSRDDLFRETATFTIFDDEQEIAEFHYPLAHSKSSSFFADTVFDEIITGVIAGGPNNSDTIYIPAARTGLMLALGPLVAESLGNKESTTSKELPQPLLAFLRRMARPYRHSRSRQFAKLASWLSENVAHGSIETHDGPGLTEFKYKPQGMEVELPLHATSSMITELAPFLVAMNNELRGSHLIFEEPEAHLHLEAQRGMARAIARLVSTGTQVTVTTHSDTFLQQINNLMNLHAHPKRRELMKRLGYERADLIDPAKVEAYEFQPTESGTIVHRLVRTQEGYVVSSLNETLLSLAKETLLLREGQHD